MMEHLATTSLSELFPLVYDVILGQSQSKWYWLPTFAPHSFWQFIPTLWYLFWAGDERSSNIVLPIFPPAVWRCSCLLGFTYISHSSSDISIPPPLSHLFWTGRVFAFKDSWKLLYNLDIIFIFTQTYSV